MKKTITPDLSIKKSTFEKLFGFKMEASSEDKAVISAIAERAKREFGHKIMDTIMDITAVHANGCPLRLEELLAADGFNFAHDIEGIRAYINRQTGKLTNHFLPRFSKPQHKCES